MEYLLNQLVNGICQGAIYAMMAIGYSVVVGVVGMVTFTHGEVIMIGAFAAYYAFEMAGNHILLGIIFSFSAAWLVGVCVYKICYEQFFNAPRNISMLCTIGFSMVVKNLAQIVFGPNQKPMLNIVDNKIYKLGVVQISTVQIVVVITVVVSATVLSFFFNKTRWGIRLRAARTRRRPTWWGST